VGLHPQARRALELWRQGPAVTDPGFGAVELAALRAQRREAAALERREPVPASVDLDADAVACRLHVPTEAATHPVLVFLHGGGFVFGDLDTHDAHARRLALRTGHAVLAVHYRRPPEHPFPAAPDDVDTVLAWLGRHGAEHGLDVTRTSVVGDSAGANLALVAALRHPDRFAALVLAYPFLDPEAAAASYDREDGGLTRDEARWYWQQYAATPADRRHPDLAPLRSGDDRLTRIGCPVLVQIAGEDVLVDEDLVLVDRLAGCGVDVRATTYDGMIHGFWRQPDLFDAADAALAEIAGFLPSRG
jgi:acetyl esterase